MASEAQGAPAQAAAVTVDTGRLQAFTTSLFEHLGFRLDDAAVVADVLVRTDLRGHDSHGLRYLPTYVPLIRGGGVRADAEPFVVQETSASAVLDGDAGMGHVVMHRATQIAIEKVRAGSAIAMVVVRNSNHFGAADPYSLMCAEAGLIGIVTTNAVPGMAAPGSRGAVVSTAPLSYGVPHPDGRHLVLDMALSVTAGTRVGMAAERGESIPEGWLSDAEGRPTTDPAALPAGGALLPVGAHKGWALSLLVETLSGVLSGAGILSEVLYYSKFPESPSQTGHAIIAIDPDAFLGPDEFGARVTQMVDEIHRAPRAAGVDRLLVPGELELEHEAHAREHGLEIDGFTWTTLLALAEDVGLKPELEGCVR
jgi:LDH2 family malate/lactate/ureidoglycolate dehydrogenase